MRRRKPPRPHDDNDPFARLLGSSRGTGRNRSEDTDEPNPQPHEQPVLERATSWLAELDTRAAPGDSLDTARVLAETAEQYGFTIGELDPDTARPRSFELRCMNAGGFIGMGFVGPGDRQGAPWVSLLVDARLLR